MLGDIDERGRLPPSTRLATGAPPAVGSKLKSVSSLLSTMPPATSELPKPPSTVEVSDATLPAASTAAKWVVDGTSPPGAEVRGWAPFGMPAFGLRHGGEWR